MSLVFGSDLAVAMRSTIVLHLLLWVSDETRTKLIVGWSLKWICSSWRSLRPPLNFMLSSWKLQSWCRDSNGDGNGDTETEFLQLLQEPFCVFWRKAPLFTVEFYFGKSAAGYCSLWASQKAPGPHPKMACFVSSEQTQLCFKFLKTKSGKWNCTSPSCKITCSKLLSNVSGIAALLLATDIKIIVRL